ncbi:hypothetical protein IWQ54_002909 [Labrenzia sp. EL_195]|nr:hypothetical protein [Labrenzia sp. EL_195]
MQDLPNPVFKKIINYFLDQEITDQKFFHAIVVMFIWLFCTCSLFLILSLAYASITGTIISISAFLYLTYFLHRK